MRSGLSACYGVRYTYRRYVLIIPIAGALVACATNSSRPPYEKEPIAANTGMLYVHQICGQNSAEVAGPSIYLDSVYKGRLSTDGYMVFAVGPGRTRWRLVVICSNGLVRLKSSH